MVASFQTPNLAQPSAGSMALSLALDFRSVSRIDVDLSNDIQLGKLDFIQSAWADNADNSTTLDLTFNGGPIPQRVRWAANQQGWQPASAPFGAARLTAQSNAGTIINVMLANFAMPYMVNSPPSGILVVPPLTNKANNAVALINGNNQLVAGVAAQTIKLYRGIFEVDAPTTLKFTDGPGGTVLFTAFLTTGGSINLPVSGVPWFNTSAGNDLTINSSAAVNLFGGFGFVQS